MNEDMNRFAFNTEGKICDYGYEEPKVLNEQEILEELNWLQNANDFFREENEIQNYKNECLLEETDKNEKIISKLSADLTVSEEVIEDLQRELALTKKELDKAIVLPIKIGEKCWTINCWCSYGDAKIGEPYVVTKYELHENIVSGYEIFKSIRDNKLTITPRAKQNYFGVQPYLFATEEEARAKLKELKNGNTK